MNILILTEAGKNIGLGHLTRCIALYQTFELEGDKPELIVNSDESVLRFIKDKDYKIMDWIKEQGKLREIIKNPDVVVIDSYLAPKSLYDHISNFIYSEPKSKPQSLLMVDDYKRIDYPQGIIVNPSIYGNELQYPRGKGRRYLLGKDYIILRKEFWDVSEKVINREVKNILLTFGRPKGVSLLDEMFLLIKDKFGFNVETVNPGSRFLTAKDMLRLMLAADICISGGGQTTYELARVGVPTIGICFADNQKMNLERWQEEGFIEYAGRKDDDNLKDNIGFLLDKMLSQQVRLSMNSIGRQSLSGESVKRIIAESKSYVYKG